MNESINEMMKKIICESSHASGKSFEISKLLPEVDSSNEETWGKTFAEMVKFYAEASKNHNSIVYNGDEMTVDDFVNDNFSAPGPWGNGNRQWDKFMEAALRVGGFREAVMYLVSQTEDPDVWGDLIKEWEGGWENLEPKN